MSPATANIHGVAVAAGEDGMLILGASGAGKSALAARMIAAWPFGAVRLVADDRVLLASAGGRLIARPHPAIAGQIEMRGVGIAAPPSLEAIVLRGVLRLSAAQPERLPAEPAEENLLGVRLPAIILWANGNAFQSLTTLWPHFHARMSSIRSILVCGP